MVVEGMFCVSSHFTPFVWTSLTRAAKNCWLSLVGTETATGLSVARMPETRVRLILPLFFVSWTEVAVMTICRPGYLV